MWNFNKPTKDRSRAELELQETFDHVRELEAKIKKLEAVVDGLYVKAQVSHSLLVVRKISEERIEEMEKLLD